jgi:filamentous hemagglutinin family protein
MAMATRWLNHTGITQAALVLFLSMLFPLTFSPLVSLAEVATNITSTTGTGDLGTTVTHTGHLYDIEGGTRLGDGTGPILFHSFGDFSVGPRDIANFCNDSGRETSNIIGRVTELGVAHTSYIYGTIQTTGFDVGGLPTNLFLVNPNGIVFGPQGSFNVGGSVSFSTAQYLRLFDSLNGVSANFYANPASDGLANSVFAMAPVVDFGFLSPAAYGFLTAPDSSATITVKGSTLSVLPGQSISLVGGKVVIKGGAQLSAPGGRIHLASTASPGEFAAPPGESLANATTLQAVPNVDGVSGVPFTSFVSASLAPGSSIDVHGTNTVFVKGGQLVLSVKDATLNTSEILAQSDTISLSPGSSIVTSNSGAAPGADVQLIASSVQMEGASISTLTFGPGRGGDVIVTAGTLYLDGDSGISTETDFVGHGGDLQLNVGTLTLAGGASLKTLNNDSTGTTDDDGKVTLGVGGDIIIRGVNGLGSYATDVTITGRGSFDSSSEIKTENNIFTFASEFAGGKGGSVMIASQSITLDGGEITSLTNGFIGPGGEIDLGLRQLTITNGGQIESSTGTFDASGPGGHIKIDQFPEGLLAPSVTLSGSGINGLSAIFSLSTGNANPGEISITTGTFNLADGAVIKTGDPDSGPQGAGVTIHASNSVNITTGSAIFSQASTLDAGPLVITTPTLSMNQGLINTSTIDVGHAGNITLNVGKLTIENGSRVESSTIGSGSAGSITVQGLNGTTGSRADSVTIRDQGGLFTETGKVGINENSAAEGTGGNITIVSNMFTLENGASISAASSSISSLAKGGSITVDANLATVRTGAFITTESIRTTEEGGAAPGGDVVITAQALTLDHGSISAATAGSGDGGDITLTSSDSVTLQDHALVSASSQGTGNAGSITIDAGQQYLSTNSAVTTQAAHASGGDITVNAQEMIRLINSQINTSVAGGDTTFGGNIKIDPQFVVLQNSQILAQAFAGTGGNITIISNVFLADPNSLVDASSQLGISGTINIQSPLQNVGGELTALSQEFSSAAALLAQQCAARAAGGTFSTFVVAAREGLPVEPGGFLASPSLPAELLGSRLSGRAPQTQLSAVTDLFPKYDARPIQLVKFEDACRQ